MGYSNIEKRFLILVSTVLLVVQITAETSLVLSQAQMDGYDCETCSMIVGADAQLHFRVTDLLGKRHYVDCFECALKLLKTHDQIYIDTFCDWYGPDYQIIVDIRCYGGVTVVDPPDVLLLVGGSCTNNRVAYNQTAADFLLAYGYSQYTMMMQQQSLPPNTQTATIEDRALNFVKSGDSGISQSSLFLWIAAIVGVAILAGSILAYRILKKGLVPDKPSEPLALHRNLS